MSRVPLQAILTTASMCNIDKLNVTTRDAFLNSRDIVSYVGATTCRPSQGFSLKNPIKTL